MSLSTILTIYNSLLSTLWQCLLEIKWLNFKNSTIIVGISKHQLLPDRLKNNWNDKIIPEVFSSMIKFKTILTEGIMNTKWIDIWWMQSLLKSSIITLEK